MRVIKKYSNRRLYDTVESRYVNLDELARLVVEGEQVEVRDARSGEDLTRAVLLQVVLEVQEGARLFPVGLLHRMIRFGGDHPLQRAALQQMGAGLELLDAQMRQMEQQLAWMRPPGARKAAAAPPRDAGAAPPRDAPPPDAPPPHAPPPDAPPPDAPPPDEPPADALAAAPPPAAAAAHGEDPELAALRARLAALEKRLRR